MHSQNLDNWQGAMGTDIKAQVIQKLAIVKGQISKNIHTYTYTYGQL